MMKKSLLTIAASLALTFTVSAAMPRAIYVKDSEGFHKYSFGVAGDLHFSEDGKTLNITGYEEGIDLNAIEYITFDAPFDQNALTPTAQKDKLIKVAKEFLGALNVGQHAELYRAIVDFDENCTNVDLGDLLDTFYENHPDFKDEDDYYNKIRLLVRAFYAPANADANLLRKARKVYTELFTTNDFVGVFKMVPHEYSYENDYTEGRWVKIKDADYFEIQYPGLEGATNVVRVTPSSDYTVWEESFNVEDHWDEDDSFTVNGKIHMPKTLVATFERNGKTLGTINLNTLLDCGAKTIDVDIEAVALNHKFTDKVHVANEKIDANIVFYIDNQAKLTTDAFIKGTDIVNIQRWIDNIEAMDGYYDYKNDEYVDDDPHPMLDMFTRAQAYVNVLDQVQVMGNCANFSKLYDEAESISEDDDDTVTYDVDYDKGTLTVTWGTPETCEKHSALFNDYFDATVHYDHTPEIQAFLTWGASLYVDDYPWYTDGYWDQNLDKYIELDKELLYIYREWEFLPTFTFADGTCYDFEDYFDEKSFSSVTDLFDDIIDTIENIVETYQDKYDEED